MIRVVVIAPDGKVESGGVELLDRPELRAGDRPEGTTVWIDVLGFEPESQAFVAQCEGLHPLAVDDAFALQHQPKVEEFADLLFLIVRGIDFNQETEFLRTLKLAAFLRTGELVTVHRAPLRSVERVFTNVCEGRVTVTGPEHLLYLLTNQIVELYLPLLDRMSEKMEALEDEVFEEPQEVQLESILDLRRELASLRRVMQPHRQIFSHLANAGSAHIDEHHQSYFRDVYDKVFRVTDSLDQLRDQLSSIRDTYLSLISHRTNEVMKTLTVISAILLPLTFLAGLYGMNFQWMPELQYRYGYFVLLGVMGVVGGGLFWWFRRRGWF